MSSVYLLTQGEYSDYSVHSVWSTREEAERQAAFRNAAHRTDWFQVEEYHLDVDPLTAGDVVHGWWATVAGEEPGGVVVGEPEPATWLSGERPPGYVEYAVSLCGVGRWGGLVYGDTPDAVRRSGYDRAAKAKAGRLGL